MYEEYILGIIITCENIIIFLLHILTIGMFILSEMSHLILGVYVLFQQIFLNCDEIGFGMKSNPVLLEFVLAHVTLKSLKAKWRAPSTRSICICRGSISHESHV